MTGAVERLTREIRACFNRLKALADALHADLGVTASQRAVLEDLAEGGETTVAAMARRKGVSRQHIQALANALLAGGWVTSRPNPDDRRAPLVGLTDAGRTTMAEIRRREAAHFAALDAALGADDVAGASEVLKGLRRALDRRLDDTAHGR